MSGSFTRVNYLLRPAKGVERRMMADTFLRLRPFGSIESYRYVGMGSVYFADFTLFHAICGFTNLVSIEDAEDEQTQNRFKFNVPLGSIEMRFGNSNDELSKLQWNVRSICWLDYDYSLDGSVLKDVMYLGASMAPGSVLVVTVDGRLRDEKRKLLDQLIAQIDDERKVPTSITAANKLRKSQIKSVFRSIMTQELKQGISDRNAGVPTEQRVTFQQIFNFEYNDKAPMLTIGWVIFDEGQRGQFEACELKKLGFIRSGDQPFVIAPPFLTPREMHELNRCDAKETYRSSELPLPGDERENYEKIRRYWPTGGYSEMT